jgi:hypothetical protein
MLSCSRTLSVHGQFEHGIRSVFLDEEVENPDEFGVDWDDLDDHHIRNHHDTNNPDDARHANPFVSPHPEQLSGVEVPEARCPFSLEQIQHLDNALVQLPYISSLNMHSRSLLWIEALSIASQMI